MTMHRIAFVLLPGFLALLTLPVWAEDPAPQAPAAPQAAPGPAAASAAQQAEIQDLIQKLGHPDFETRQRASKRLLEIGEPARKALDQTMNHSDDMEARWRAEQILRRLDRSVEKPLGSNPESPPRPAPAPRPQIGIGPMPPAWPGSRIDDLERRLEEMRRKMDEQFGRFGPVEKKEVLEAPGLKLRIDVWGLIPTLTLEVLPKEGDPRTRRPMYRGRSLDEILRRHPELQRHEGMGALKEKYDAFRKANRALFPFDEFFRPDARRTQGKMKMVSGGREIEIDSNGERTKVRVTERGKDGRPVTREYEGKDLEQIKREHPELAPLLGSFGVVSLRLGPTQLFRDRLRPKKGAGPGTSPRPPVVTPRPTAEQGAFGIRARVVPEVLASQLLLAPKQGMMVERVVPGSQADALGLRQYDIVMSVNGQPVTDLHTAIGILKMSAEDSAPLTLEVIRAGKRMMLKR
jgi:hypothetical protein